MNGCKIIKNQLENFFDIPFSVKHNYEHKDPVFLISPVNELEELFEIKISSRQSIRIIAEVYPQKYASNMVEDINKASEEKQALFFQYINTIKKKGAKLEFYINGISQNMLDNEIWQENWNKFRIRSTYILPELSSEDEFIEYVIDWSKLFTGLILSLLNIESVESFDSVKEASEGKIYKVLTNKYERNPINRELCLEINGYSCKVCGFNFEKMYGPIGKDFIHVHHIEMVSTYGGERMIDPAVDLIPVCPNCHYMLHRENPPIEPEVLKNIISKVRDME